VPKQSRGEAEGIATPDKLELRTKEGIPLRLKRSFDPTSRARNDKRQVFRTIKDLVEINSTTMPQMKIESPFCGTIWVVVKLHSDVSRRGLGISCSLLLSFYCLKFWGEPGLFA